MFVQCPTNIDKLMQIQVKLGVSCDSEILTVNKISLINLSIGNTRKYVKYIEGIAYILGGGAGRVCVSLVV